MALPRPAPTPDRLSPSTTDVWRDIAPRLSTRRALLLIATVFVLASFVAGPTKPGTPSPTAHWQLGPIYVGRPIVTWGDPPHYLVVVNSILEDRDLDLRNNYARAARGEGWDVGTRFRGTELDHHVEADAAGRELSFHPPFLPVLLAAVAWPFRGTEWVESVCIWFTIAVTLGGLWCCTRMDGFTGPWLVALALATPLWAYARDVWTEAHHASAWAALLVLEHPVALAAVVIAGVLMKLPFVLVPLALGAVAFWRGEGRRGAVLVGSSVVAVALAVGAIQYVFAGADHFDWFHLPNHGIGRAGGFRARGNGIVGLLFGPENGLLLFCPFVFLGFRALTKDARLLVPVLAVFFFHASYAGWRAGSGVSARYLIPMLPVLVLAVARSRPRGWITAALVAYSAVLATIAGVLPVAAYDKTPWGMLEFLVSRLHLLAG